MCAACALAEGWGTGSLWAELKSKQAAAKLKAEAVSVVSSMSCKAQTGRRSAAQLLRCHTSFALSMDSGHRAWQICKAGLLNGACPRTSHCCTAVWSLDLIRALHCWLLVVMGMLMKVLRCGLTYDTVLLCDTGASHYCFELEHML